MRFNLLILSLLMANVAYAGRVDSMEIYSPSMRKNIKCLVVTPDNYSVMGKPYPVLYLLHGWSGNFAGWLGDAPQLRQHADTYQMLIVCPDGGYDSWYLDSPVDSTVRYETHISKEVVQFVDYYYYTRQEPGGRAIAGLSMGGHGAMSLAIRHPEVFGAAGSMAGGLDLRPWKSNNWDLKGVLGDLHEAEKIREMHDARDVGVGELDAFSKGETVGGHFFANQRIRRATAPLPRLPVPASAAAFGRPATKSRRAD